MAVKNLEEFLRDFYNEEKKSLLHNYPGLTQHRLKEDLILYAQKNGFPSEDFFEGPYFPSLSHPLTIFFEEVRKGTPLEYITGEAFFYRSSFKVTTDVLIPRSETEILVELAAQELQKNYKNKKCRLIDIGTGSGAIILSLMTEEGATLEAVASDISDKALEVARANYFNQRFMIPKKHMLSFKKSDRLKGVEGSFDIILSNPPYIKKSGDFDQVHHQVAAHEPHLALFLDDVDYDSWFHDFFQSIYEKLSDTGVSLIEGHENHLEAQALMAKDIGFTKVDVIKDYTHRNRFLKLKK